MTVEPLRVAFRRELRARALSAAAQATLEDGWARVRMGGIAEAVGVSRPTLYKEFGDKAGLGQALVQSETERFLIGVQATLDAADGDLAGAVRAAVLYTLEEAGRSPLLRAVLTSTRDDAVGLLPLLTTRSGPLLDSARQVVGQWLAARLPEVPAADAAAASDALVRLVVSHLVLPGGDAATTADSLAQVALRYLAGAAPG